MGDKLLGIAFVAIIASLVGLAGFAAWDAFVRWPAYRDAHHCAETGATKRRRGVYCHPVGKTTICSPRTYTDHEWLCDGGERIWR